MNTTPKLNQTNKLSQKRTRLSHYIAGIAITLAAIASASAQNYPSQNNQQQGVNYVTVYEDCDFRGKSRSLAVGDYNDISRVNIGNDKISSIQISSGLQVVAYEHENLRGDNVTFNSNVSCLNKGWNDQISSLRVIGGSNDYNSQNQNNNDLRYGNGRNPQPRVGYGDYGNSANNVTKNVSRIWFANTILKQGNDRLWRISNPNGTVDTFSEVNRTARHIFLRNNANGQAVQVDLQSNNVRFVTPGGQHIDYAISRSEKGKSSQQTKNNANNAGGSKGVINSRCFNYRAYARGGQGGVQFHGHPKNKHFGKKGLSGKICHDGALTMVLSKTDPNTEVFVDIKGRTYSFKSNEPHDILKNTWYRKMIKLKVNN